MESMEYQMTTLELDQRLSSNSPSHRVLPLLEAGDHGHLGLRAASAKNNSGLDEFDFLERELKLDYNENLYGEPEQQIDAPPKPVQIQKITGPGPLERR